MPTDDERLREIREYLSGIETSCHSGFAMKLHETAVYLLAQLDEARQQLADVRRELEAVTDRIATVATERESAKARESQAVSRLATITAERDAALAEVERLRARLSEHEQPELLPCTDCNRDWGHSYCGVCGGSGFVRNPRSIAALKGTP